MITFALAFAWVLAASAAALSMEPEGRIGDLGYDTARWKVSETGGTFVVTCREDQCDDISTAVTFAPGDVSACSGAAMMSADNAFAAFSRDPKLQTIAKPGFDIHVVTSWTGCRNARPPTVHACTAYKGNIYRFDALVGGCSGGPGFSGGTLEFLDGLSGR